jgi:hypothetical protein
MRPGSWNRLSLIGPYKQSIDYKITRDIKDDGLAHFQATWTPDDPSMIPGSATGYARTVRIEKLKDGLWYAMPFCGPKDTGYETPYKAAEAWLELMHG